MPTGKRASMREGPLAALFRKTAQDTQEHTAEPSPTSSPDLPATDPAASAEEREIPAARPPEPEVVEPRIPLPHDLGFGRPCRRYLAFFGARSRICGWEVG